MVLALKALWIMKMIFYNMRIEWRGNEKETRT